MQTNLRMKTLKPMIKDVEPNKYVLEADKSPGAWPGSRDLLFKFWDLQPAITFKRMKLHTLFFL